MDSSDRPQSADRGQRRRHSDLKLPIAIKAPPLDDDSSWDKDDPPPIASDEDRTVVLAVDVVVFVMEIYRVISSISRASPFRDLLWGLASRSLMLMWFWKGLRKRENALYVGHVSLFMSHISTYFLFGERLSAEALLFLGIRNASYAAFLPIRNGFIVSASASLWADLAYSRLCCSRWGDGGHVMSWAIHVVFALMVGGVKEGRRRISGGGRLFTPRTRAGTRSRGQVASSMRAATSPPSTGARSSIETLKDLLACAHSRVQASLDMNDISREKGDIRQAKHLLERCMQLITSGGNLYEFQPPDHDSVNRVSEILYGFDPVSYHPIAGVRGSSTTVAGVSAAHLLVGSDDDSDEECSPRIPKFKSPFKRLSRATTFAQTLRRNRLSIHTIPTGPSPSRGQYLLARNTAPANIDRLDSLHGTPVGDEDATTDTSPSPGSGKSQEGDGLVLVPHDDEDSPSPQELIDVRWCLFTDKERECYMPRQTEKLSSIVGREWSYSFLKLAVDSDDHALVEAGYVLLERHRNKCSLRCTESQLVTFLSTIESLYQDKHYHSRTHGALVAHTLHLLSQSVFANNLTPLDQSLLALSGLCHDVGHPGLNNAFYVKSGNPLAVVYNDQSVLEHYHSSLTFSVLRRPECAVFAGAQTEEFRQVRQSIIELILATDLKFNGDLCAKLRIRRESPQFDQINNFDDKWMCAKLCIAAADVAHVTLPWEEHVMWAARIEEELYMQGDEESKLGLQISPLCDRSKSAEFPRHQRGFLTFIAMPTFELLGEVDSSNIVKSLCVSRIEANIEGWENEAQAAL